RDMGAAAFALGQDICFAEDRYAPETVEGQLLLGHELTHVVQQNVNTAPSPTGAGQQRAEQEARQVTRELASGGSLDVSTASPVAPALAEESWWDTLFGGASTAANVTSAGTNAAMIAGDAANAAKLGAGGLTGWLGGLPGVS